MKCYFSLFTALLTTFASFAYTLGATGNRIASSEIVNGTSHTYAWAYDYLYRLTSESIQNIGIVNYQFDAVGNRTNRTSSVSGLNNQNFAFNPNDWQTNTDNYDSNGNTIVSGTTNYQYDVLNHLTNANSGAILITYDGDGNRVSKKVGGVTTYYLVDDKNPSGYAQVLEEYQGSSLSKVYNYGLVLISQRQANGTVSYFGSDGHGSTRFLLNTSGGITDTYVYDAYGTLITSTGSTSNSYLYCGQQWDSDLQMYYLRARYYKPNYGRFWTFDSYEGNIEDPLSLHKYLYCQADPVMGTDPSGHAVYFVERHFEGAVKQFAWVLNFGHGYLLFTATSDDGSNDPFSTHQPILHTFSWHPHVWDMYNSPYYNGIGVPGRVWDNDTEHDWNPGRLHNAVLVTADADEQSAILNSVNGWIAAAKPGYELGAPRNDPNSKGNEIGSQRHVSASPDGVFYSLYGQNCVWWATVMLMNSGIHVQSSVYTEISNFNHGLGYASYVIKGMRSSKTFGTMRGIPFGISLSIPGYNLSGFDTGL